jgi:restriction endonuclease
VPKKTTHRSFTLRVPIDFYLEIAEKAQAEGIAINQLANRVLRLGFGKHVEVDQAIRSLLLDRMVADPVLREAIKQQVTQS